jgi:hypothetical protein
VTVAVPGLLELGFSQLGLQLLSVMVPVPVAVAFAGSAPLGAVGQFCHTMLVTTFSAPNPRVVGWPLPLVTPGYMAGSCAPHASVHGVCDCGGAACGVEVAVGVTVWVIVGAGVAVTC